MSVYYLNTTSPRNAPNSMPGSQDRPPSASVTSPQPGVEVIQPFQQFQNRRAEPRFDCKAKGALLLVPSGAEVACEIVNQSASGAQVLVKDMPHKAGDLWLLDVGGQMVKFGSPVWTQPHKMGLRFSFAQKVDPNGVRPPRVPEPVWKAWRRLAGLDIPPPEEDVFFLD